MVDSMIILFDSTSTEFTTNGLGTLQDAVSCFVTEERNGEFELEMEYPITGRRYNDLSLRKIIFAKPNPYDDPQPFRIYFISKPMDGIITINAEHISYDLSGYPVSPFAAGTVTTAFSMLKESSAIECPFTFFTDKSTAANMTVLKPSSMRSLLGAVEGSILDIYGGEYEFDKYSVKLWNNRGRNRGVSIRYGKNLTDLKQEENCNSVYTGVYPYWYSEQYGLVQLSEKIVNAEGVYNFTRIYPLDLSLDYQEIPTAEQLRSRAITYMNSNNIGVPKVSITVEFVPLSQTEDYKNFAILETVHLCDTVNVYFPEMNIATTAKCIKTVYDVISEKYDKIELGDAKLTLASTVSEQNQSIKKVPTKTFMEQAIDHATKLISGGLGGYVTIHSSTGGSHPDEILIMDTDDIATAVNVWRWNSGGLGYSSTGYNGEFSLAITSDGRIVADFITAGTFDASQVNITNLKAGSIFVGESTTSVQDKINELDALEIGGRNLLRDSGAERTTTRFISVDTYEDLAEYIGENVVVSFDLRIETDGVLREINCAYAYQENGISIASYGLYCTPSQLGAWQRFSVYTQVKDWGIVNPAYTKGAIAFYDYIGANHYSIRNIKIEKGNKSTDWTPAPEDVSAEVATRTAEVQEAARIAAEDYANAQKALTDATAKAYADGILTTAENKAIAEAAAALSAANQNLNTATTNLQNFVLQHVSDETAEIKSYIRSNASGNLEIGSLSGASKLVQSPTAMTFMVGTVPVATFGSGETDMPKAGVDTELRIGDKTSNYHWISNTDGGMSLIWK